MRWMAAAFRRSIQFRLTGYFLVILLPLVGVSLYANYTSQTILEQQIGERTRGAMLSTLDNIDVTMQSVQDVSALLATDKEINDALNRAGATLQAESIYSFKMILSRLSNVATTNNSISQAAIVHTDSGMLISSQGGGTRLKQGYDRSRWFEEAVRASGKSVLYVPKPGEKDTDSFAASVISSDSLHLTRLMDLYSPRRRNVLAVSVKRETLVHMMRHLVNSERTNVYLVKNGETIAATTSTEPLAPEWTTDPAETQIRQSPLTNERLFLLKAHSPESGLSLVMVQPEADIFRKTDRLRQFTLLIIGISLLLALWIAWAVYSGIATPLRKIAGGMKQIKLGNLTARVVNRRQDEIGYLTDSFNQMAAEQQHLIRDGYEKQLRLLGAEFNLLQSQINPHFLYNTLDSIYSTAIEYDVEEISEMVLHLSKFFRISLGKGKETFTLEETIDHLKYYVRIQEIRYYGNFQVRYEIAEETKPVPLLKLLLQPLIENAIIHGIEKRNDGGLLTIRSSMEDGKLMLVIEDNGPGIDRERLQLIQHQLGSITVEEMKWIVHEQANVPAKELFGLRNVVSRLKLHYGDGATLRIDSREPEGTRVTLLIPAYERMAAHEPDDRGGRTAAERTHSG